MAPAVNPTRGCSALCCVRFLRSEPSAASCAAGTPSSRAGPARAAWRGPDVTVPPALGTAAAPAGARPPCSPEPSPVPRSCAPGRGVSRAGQWYLWLSGPGGEQLPSPSGVLGLVLGWDPQSRACALGCWELVASRLCAVRNVLVLSSQNITRGTSSLSDTPLKLKEVPCTSVSPEVSAGWMEASFTL